MIIFNKSVSLIKLEEKDLEKIRIWRNSDHIRQHMDYRQIITPEMQLNWFKNLNNECNYFFVINYQNTSIGLIQIQDINWGTKTASSGLFIGEQKFQGSPIAYLASLPLLDLGFNLLGLNRIFAKVSKKNSKALEYNQSLGFTIDHELDESFISMSMDSLRFQQTIQNHPIFNRFRNSYQIKQTRSDPKLILNQGLFISNETVF